MNVTITAQDPGALQAALSAQTLGAWQLAPATAPLVSLQGRVVLVSQDDGALAAALQADRFLLEKIALACVAHQPAPLWLVPGPTVGGAYPGLLLPGAPRAGALGHALLLWHLIDADARLAAAPRQMIVAPPRAEPAPAPGPPRWELGGADGRQRAEAGWRAHAPLRLPAPEPRTEPGILVVLPWVVHGGVDRAVADLLRGLAAAAPGLRRYLVTTLDAPMVWAEQVLPACQGVFSLPALAREAHYPEALCALAERLGVGTVLVVNSQAGLDALPLLKERLPGVRVIVQCHGFDYHRETGEPLGHPAYAATRYDPFIDGYAVISARVGELLQQRFYVAPQKIRVIRIGIDTAWFTLARRPRFSTDGALTVLWLGRLAPEKDPLMVLQIASRLRARGASAGVRLLLAGGASAGEEPLRQALWRRYVDEGLEDLVTLVGAMDSPLPLYRAADCLLLTSRYEGMPLVILEAMAAAMPVITPVANTSIAEVLPAELGLHVAQQDDADAYVDALLRLRDDPAAARARCAAMAAQSAGHDRAAYVAAMRAFCANPDM